MKILELKGHSLILCWIASKYYSAVFIPPVGLVHADRFPNPTSKAASSPEQFVICTAQSSQPDMNTVIILQMNVQESTVRHSEDSSVHRVSHANRKPQCVGDHIFLLIPASLHLHSGHFKLLFMGQFYQQSN